MSTPWRDIVAELETEYETMHGVAVPFTWGEKERHEHGAPPAVHFVPLNGTTHPPRKGGYNPRPLYDCALAHEVDCYGEDEDGADAIWRNVLNVIYAKLRGAAELGAMQWVTEQSDKAAWMNGGACIRQVVTIRNPVTEGTCDTRTIEEVEMEGDLEGEV